MSLRDRRAFVAGSVMVISIWLLVRGVPSLVREAQELESAIVRDELIVSSTLRRAGATEQLEDTLRAYEEAATAIPRLLLIGSDAETARVDLASRVRRIAESLRLPVDGFEASVRGTEAGPLALAVVAFNTTTDVRGVAALVRAIVADSTLSIEALSMDQGSEGADAPQSGILRVRADIGAWYRPPTMMAP